MPNVWERPCRGLLHWPPIRHFNWATDYFDRIAVGNDRPALRLVDDKGHDQALSFAELAGLLRDALAADGIDVEVGERPGEYCPGRYSVHLRDGPKVAGLAQRVVSGAPAHVARLGVGPVLAGLARYVG